MPRKLVETSLSILDEVKLVAMEEGFVVPALGV